MTNIDLYYLDYGSKVPRGDNSGVFNNYFTSKGLDDILSLFEDNPLYQSFELVDMGAYKAGTQMTKKIGFYRSYEAYQNGNVSLRKNYFSVYSIYSENGSGTLTYPAGNLVIEEVMLAGENSYLVNGIDWTLTSLYDIVSDRTGYNSFFMYSSTGTISNVDVSKSASYLRPAMTLKVGTTYTSGTGTTSDPYIIN